MERIKIVGNILLWRVVKQIGCKKNSHNFFIFPSRSVVEGTKIVQSVNLSILFHTDNLISDLVYNRPVKIKRVHFCLIGQNKLSLELYSLL